MPVETTRSLGPRFFQEQDRLRGGPADELCAPNYQAFIGDNPPMNLAGHQQFAKAFYAGFPDIGHTIDDVVADRSRAAVRFTLRGTHTADFMGIPATGKPIVVSAIAILQVAGGKVIELRAVFDQYGMMQQLGVLPPSG